MIFILLAAGFVVHLLLQRYFVFNGIGINILMLMTIQISLLRGSEKGQEFGFFSGLLEDIVTAGLVGEMALLRTAIGFISGRLKGKFSEGNFFFQFFLTFIVFICFSYAGVVIRMIFAEPYSAGLLPIILYSLLNALFALPVYKIILLVYAG